MDRSAVAPRSLQAQYGRADPLGAFLCHDCAHGVRGCRGSPNSFSHSIHTCTPWSSGLYIQTTKGWDKAT
jgi:hypothetical protein